MFGKMLVCLDGSKRAEQILPYAVEQASRFRSHIVLVRVVTGVMTIPPDASGVPAYTGEMVTEQIKLEENEARKYLEEVAQSLQEKGFDVETVVLQHPPVGEAIVDYARKSGVDIIALASHGHSGLGRLVIGSTADHILRHSGLPMLVVRPEKISADSNNDKRK
jgi:nucleotide-binding universal stress UspA family protein